MSELLQLENGYDRPELIIMANALGKSLYESSLKDNIINELRTDNFNGKIENLEISEKLKKNTEKVQELQKVIEDLKKTKNLSIFNLFQTHINSSFIKKEKRSTARFEFSTMKNLVLELSF